MAEFMMKDLVGRRGLQGEFEIASAATSDEECRGGRGNPVYPPAAEELGRHGIACEGKRARQMTRADYDRYDYLIGMEDVNIRNMLRILGGDPQGKVSKLLDYTEHGGNISDPWYSGDFEGTYRDLEEGLRGFMRFLGYDRETGNGEFHG